MSHWMLRHGLILAALIVALVAILLLLQVVPVATADSVSGTVNGPVRLILNTGRTIFYSGATITVYPAAPFNGSGTTQIAGADGTTSYNLSYGDTYGFWARKAGSFNVTFTLTPNEQDYYVMVSNTSCNVVSASQINVVYPLHSVGITFNQWLLWNIGGGAEAAMYLEGQQVVPNQSTDDSGHVNFYLYGNTKYNLLVTRGSDNLAKWFNRTFDGSTYSLDVTGAFHKSSIVNNATSNQSGSLGNPDVDLTTNVLPSKNMTAPVSGDLLCNYTDLSGSTQSVTILVYTRDLNDPANMTLLHTETITGDQDISYNYHITGDPTGLDYFVTFTAEYTDSNGNTATVERPYQISYHGPLRVIPGWPLNWYKYLAWGAMLIVGAVIGKFALAEGAVTITVMATMAYCFNWFYEYGDEYCRTIMAVMWVGSVGLVWLKREREGVI
jgi:hypothetical protein